MKLLHGEVEVVPGRPGTRQAISPVSEGMSLPGSAVVRLTNTTSQNNAYTVRLRCEGSPFWQESWYRLIPLPPAPGDKNSIPAGKRDEPGPQGTTLKLYILSGGSREVLIQFNVPKSPEARAGRYAYEIEIEAQVLNAPSEAARRDSHVVKVPGVALVRPFYQWNCELKKSVSDPHPDEAAHVKRLNPTACLELFVTNEGNDWLYCDVLLPQSAELDLECVSRRVAVRPAELGEMLPASDTGGESRLGTQRHVPLLAKSRIKTLRGEPTRQLLPINLQRVDAPTVAPSAEDAYFAGTGKVLCKPTQEKQALPGERAIVYYPLVPATLTEFFRGLFASGRTLVMAAVGLIIVAHLTIVMFQQIRYQSMKVEVLGGDKFQPGQTVTVTGPFLQGAAFALNAKIEGKDDYVDIEPEKVKKGKKPDTFELTLPNEKRFFGKQARIKAQRQVAFLPYLTPLLPSKLSRNFEYGDTITPTGPKADFLEAKLKAGTRSFEVTGSGLGKSGTVFIDKKRARTGAWTDNRIVVNVPDLKPNNPVTVEVQPENSPGVVSAGTLEIVAKDKGHGNGGDGKDGNDHGKDTHGKDGNGQGDQGKDDHRDHPPAQNLPPALEALNRANDDVSRQNAEQVALAEMAKLEAVPEGPNKDTDGIVLHQAILGFIQLKLNKNTEGHINLGKSRDWLNTQLNPGGVTYNRIRAITTAADAFDYFYNKGDNRQAMETALAAYKADSSLLVVATTLAQMQSQNGRRAAGVATLKAFRQQHPDEAQKSPLFTQVESDLGR